MKRIKPDQLRIGQTVRGKHGRPGVVFGVEEPGNPIDSAKWVAWVTIDLDGEARTRLWGWAPGETIELYSISNINEEAAA